MYLEFTALQSESLETWIAVGGFDFSNPDTPTYTAWSDMVSSSANRAAFISSLEAFLDQYGFQGVDLGKPFPSRVGAYH